MQALRAPGPSTPPVVKRGDFDWLPRKQVRKAEAAWNTQDPEAVALAYTVNSDWRNRHEVRGFVRFCSAHAA